MLAFILPGSLLIQTLQWARTGDYKTTGWEFSSVIEENGMASYVQIDDCPEHNYEKRTCQIFKRTVFDYHALFVHFETSQVIFIGLLWHWYGI